MTSEALTSFHDRINQTKTLYDELRTEISAKLNECSECLGTIEKLHREAGDMTVRLEEQLTNALTEEREWEGIKAKLAILSIKGLVHLNVGGVKYPTTVDTLTREKDTFFTALFSEQWKTERDDKDTTFFIDRNGKLFTHILEYLRRDLVPKDVLMSNSLHRSVLIEAEYFRLHSLIKKLTIFIGGTLLTIALRKKLNEFYGKEDQQWELIYKASRDGFDANAFHTRCDNQGPTMTIVQSANSYLFGGYTAVAWTSAGDSYQNDTTAFLFTLTNPHNIAPTKYLINPSNVGNAVYHNSGNDPYFGSGAMVLSNNSNFTNSTIGFPNAYVDTTGKGSATFVGATSFLTSDIEVFKLA